VLHSEQKKQKKAAKSSNEKFTCFWIKPNQKTSTKGGVKKWNNLSLFFFFYDVK